MARTIAVIGAGPGIGMATARRFGREGFNVALLARNQGRLEEFATQLRGDGVEAAGFPADVTDRPGLAKALADVSDRFGPPDVLVWNPAPTAESIATARTTTPENLQFQLDVNLLGAVAAVGQVLPEMLERKSGALLFTSAASARLTIPRTANFGMAAAGLRTYVLNLNKELAADGIYAGIAMVAGLVDPEGGAEPPSVPPTMVVKASAMADTLWDMAQSRDRAEDVLGDEEMVRQLLG